MDLDVPLLDLNETNLSFSQTVSLIEMGFKES